MAAEPNMNTASFSKENIANIFIVDFQCVKNARMIRHILRIEVLVHRWVYQILAD